jgi:dTDP-4-amino-4,6-dideoxygalactose transaminase
MDLRVTESVAERTLALPFFNRITREQVDEVCSALKDALA